MTETKEKGQKRFVEKISRPFHRGYRDLRKKRVKSKIARREGGDTYPPRTNLYAPQTMKHADRAITDFVETAK